MSTACLILASGGSSRFGYAKQFGELFDRPLFEWVKQAAERSECFDTIAVVGVDFAGGNTRQESVHIGLQSVGPHDRVVISEAARPLILPRHFKRISEATALSCAFASPLIYTPYDKKTFSYPAREDFVELQVPQAFDYDMLLEAHIRSRTTDATDDTRLMWEAWKVAPTLIPGDILLHKVTYPHDMVIAKALVDG